MWEKSAHMRWERRRWSVAGTQHCFQSVPRESHGRANETDGGLLPGGIPSFGPSGRPSASLCSLCVRRLDTFDARAAHQLRILRCTLPREVTFCSFVLSLSDSMDRLQNFSCWLSTDLSTDLSAYLFIYLFICVFFGLFVYLFNCVFFICLFICFCYCSMLVLILSRKCLIHPTELLCPDCYGPGELSWQI